MKYPPITDQAELRTALQHAATFEHWLICQFLFVAFSVRMPTAEEAHTWDPKHFILAQKLRAEFLFLSRHEMKHLGDVSNMLLALGSKPRFDWQLLTQTGSTVPIAPGLLSPLGTECLGRLAILELPPQEDAEIAEISDPELRAFLSKGSVDLYEKIQKALESDTAFAFDTSAPQVTNVALNIPAATQLGVDLRKVPDRSTALARILEIADEGRAPAAFAHYHRLKRAAQLVEFYSSFKLAEPVVRSPRIHGSNDDAILEGAAREIAIAGEQVYRLILLFLERIYTPEAENEKGRAYLARYGLAPLMEAVLRPIGEVLARTPYRPGSDKHAGLTFEIKEPITLPSDRLEAWKKIGREFETMVELVGSAPGLPSYIHRSVPFLNQQFQEHLQAGCPEGA